MKQLDKAKRLAVAALLAAGCVCLARANDGATPEVSGMVWERHGVWHLNGSAANLRLGEAIPPGGLITAGDEAPTHSITILLPDGQRLLCECYDPNTCHRGFRIPPISPPTPDVWNMFLGVRNALLLRSATTETAFPELTGRAAMAANVEIVAAINAQGEISIAPALQVLPPGRYSMSLASDGAEPSETTPPFVEPLEWSTSVKTAPLRVGKPGVYRIRVSDSVNTPRIEIELLATSASSLSIETSGLKRARETVLSWLHFHEGWPLHGFLRVYLQSRESLNS